MHTFHLGILLWAAGSALVILADHGAWGLADTGKATDRLSKRLGRGYADFASWCTRNKVTHSQPSFSAAGVGHGENIHEFPVFKGKAHNTRCVVAWLQTVLCRFSGTFPVENALFFSLCRTLNIMHGFDEPYLPHRIASEFCEHGRLSLLLYAQLTDQAIKDNRALWPLRPKYHMWDHQIRHVAKPRENPRHSWCFADEDYNGRVVRMITAGRHARIKYIHSHVVFLGVLKLCRSFREDPV